MQRPDDDLELKRGDIIFFKPPKAGALAKETAIQLSQKSGGFKSGWEYVHVAIVTKSDPPTIMHLTNDGLFEQELRNSAYNAHLYDVNRSKLGAVSEAIAEAAQTIDRDSITYSRGEAVGAFVKGHGKKASAVQAASPSDADIDARKEMICSGFAAMVVRKALVKALPGFDVSVIGETRVLPAGLRQILSKEKTVFMSKSMSEGQVWKSADNQNNSALSEAIGAKINKSTASSKGLFGKITPGKLDQSMIDVLLRVNMGTMQANPDANPIINLRDAVQIVVNDGGISDSQKKYLINFLIDSASKLKIIVASEFKKNLIAGTFESTRLEGAGGQRLSEILASKERKVKSKSEPANMDVSVIQGQLIEAIDSLEKSPRLKDMMKDQIRAAKNATGMLMAIDQFNIPETDKERMRGIVANPEQLSRAHPGRE